MGAVCAQTQEVSFSRATGEQREEEERRVRRQGIRKTEWR